MKIRTILEESKDEQCGSQVHSVTYIPVLQPPAERGPSNITRICIILVPGMYEVRKQTENYRETKICQVPGLYRLAAVGMGVASVTPQDIPV